VNGRYQRTRLLVHHPAELSRCCDICLSCYLEVNILILHRCCNFYVESHVNIIMTSEGSRQEHQESLLKHILWYDHTHNYVY